MRANILKDGAAACGTERRHVVAAVRHRGDHRIEISHLVERRAASVPALPVGVMAHGAACRNDTRLPSARSRAGSSRLAASAQAAEQRDLRDWVTPWPPAARALSTTIGRSLSRFIRSPKATTTCSSRFPIPALGAIVKGGADSGWVHRHRDAAVAVCAENVRWLCWCGKARALENPISPALLIDHTRQCHVLFVVHSWPAGI